VILTVNGEAREVEEGLTVEGLVQGMDLPGGGRGIAVAVDEEVVPRGDWAEWRLREGQRVEIVVAIQGG
jgi:sulfur carrier protein